MINLLSVWNCSQTELKSKWYLPIEIFNYLGIQIEKHQNNRYPKLYRAYTPWTLARKSLVHMTFRKSPGLYLYVLETFILRHISRGKLIMDTFVRNFRTQLKDLTRKTRNTGHTWQAHVTCWLSKLLPY